VADETIAPLKRCTKCGESKPATTEFFGADRQKRDALNSTCRPCIRATSSKKYLEIKANPAACAAELERKRLSAKRRRDEDPEYRALANARCREWYSRNKEYERRRKQKNQERYRAYARKSAAKKLAAPGGRLNVNMRAAVWRSLKSAGSSKAGRSWFELVGYTLDDLRRHIERQFTKGMTWENMGEWHIDHILPLSGFKFSSVGDPEFRAAWALSNLRPLWARENQSKSAKRTVLI
jgi:hypothetical protein